MASKDLHNIIKSRVALPLEEITSNNFFNGVLFDTTFFESIEFIAVGGTVTDGQYKLVLEDANQSNFSDGAPVAAEFLIGDPDALITTSQGILSLGYVGHKRFVVASILSTGVTVGIASIGIRLIADRTRHIPFAPSPIVFSP